MRQKNSALAGKILRRCSICKRFHASFQVETPDGTVSLCYTCWKARQDAAAEDPKGLNWRVLSPSEYSRSTFRVWPCRVSNRRR